MKSWEYDMAAVLPMLQLECDPKIPRYFLHYQRVWIHDDAPLRLAEKSVRIGWTYADAFKNVRKRLRNKRRDYLFSTKDQSTAIEFVHTCYQFANFFNVTKAVKSHGIEVLRVPRFDEAGCDTGFTEEVKVGLIKFDNGSRIIAFSSNPNALRAFGGDVGLDEFAFHPAAEQLWAAAAGRVTWGYDLGLWSSSNGDTTLFHTFAREAQQYAAGSAGILPAHSAPGSAGILPASSDPPVPANPGQAPAAAELASANRWSYYRVTLLDAVEYGLVEKINQSSGRHWTREQFIEDCQARARLPEVFEQEYMCNPKGGTASIVPWSAIARCAEDYAIERLHWEEAHIIAQFGEFRADAQPEREQRIGRCLEGAFAATFAATARHAVGFDVAASGAGDLAAIYVDSVESGRLRLRALFTCRTQDWHLLKTVLFTFLRRLTAVTACGDETGLGRQICWEASRAFPGRFFPVNFRAEKHRLGFGLMNQLSVAEKQFPREPREVGADYYALRKTFQGGQWIFTEGSNAANPASHCDLAWAGALSSKAATLGTPPGPIKIFPRRLPRLQAKWQRTVQ